jgi:hypothetical protein
MNVIPETHGAHSSRYLRLFIFRMLKHQFKAYSSTDFPFRYKELRQCHWTPETSDIIRKTWRLKRGNQIIVNRRTDNTMAKRKMNKRTNNDLQNITQKTKDWATWTLLKPWGWTQVLLKGRQFLLHNWILGNKDIV